VKTEREQYRLATGFEGKFQTFGRDVHTEGYVQYSRLDGTTLSSTCRHLRVQLATDAIVVGGNRGLPRRDRRPPAASRGTVRERRQP
jgi:hypothetical protein